MRLLLLGAALLLCLRAQAQAPVWSILTTFDLNAPTNVATVRAVAVGPGGEVYVAGSFRNTIELGANVLTSAGGTDAFLAKWDPGMGRFAWAQRIGGTGNDQLNAVAVNGSSLYVAGVFTSASIRVGPLTLNNVSINSNNDLFVAKLTDTGPAAAHVWALGAGGHGDDQATALVANGPNLYLAGHFYCPRLDIGAVTLLNIDGSGFSSDVFVAKLVDGGSSYTSSWGRRGGSIGDEFAYGVAANGSEVYLAGSFSSAQPEFGGMALANADPRGFTTDAFVAQLRETSTGADFSWAWRAGINGNDLATAVTIGPAGAYAAGGFSGSRVPFGSGTLSSAGGLDAFVVKLTSGNGVGNVAWAQRSGTVGDDRPSAIALNGAGVYVASAGGLFRLADAGSSASLSWSESAPISGAMALQNGTIYVGGTAFSTWRVGPYTVSGATTNPVGFVASLVDGAVLGTTRPAAASSLLLYPNPAHDQLTVRLPDGTLPTAVRLTDSRGATAAAYAAGQACLDVSGLAPGLYLLTASAGGRQYQQKLVKQ